MSVVVGVVKGEPQHARPLARTRADGSCRAREHDATWQAANGTRERVRPSCWRAANGACQRVGPSHDRPLAIIITLRSLEGLEGRLADAFLRPCIHKMVSLATLRKDMSSRLYFPRRGRASEVR